MSAPHTITARQAHVREIADRALTLASGLIIDFPVSRYGTLSEAKRQARSFQCSFSALRARTRRKIIAVAHGPTEALSNTTPYSGQYDKLSAMLNPMPNNAGWQVELLKAHAIFEGLEVRDASTGELLEQFDPIALKNNAIVQKAFKDQLTEDEEEWWFTYRPEEAKLFFDTYGIARKCKAAALDIAEIPIEGMFGEGE